MVVAVGLTFMDPVADVEVKLPGVMAMLVAPDVIQLSVLLEPELTPVGLAVKELIVGSEPLVEDEPEVAPHSISERQARRISTSRQMRETGLKMTELLFFL